MHQKILKVLFGLNLIFFLNVAEAHHECEVYPPVEVTSYARFPSGIAALRLGSFPLIRPIIENVPIDAMIIANKNIKNQLFVTCGQGVILNTLVDLAIYSLDIGQSWNQSDLITGRAQGPTLPGAPNDFISPTDSFAASDNKGHIHYVYAAIQVVNPDGTFNPGNALNYTRSNDSGIGWNAIASIVNNLNPPYKSFVDRPTITADPYINNRLYVVWGNILQELEPNGRQKFELQISYDGGNNWTNPFTIKTLELGIYGYNAILHVLPDKSVIVIYQSNNPDGTFDIKALKSVDYVNWTEHLVYQNGHIALVTDPDDPSLYYATYMLATDSKINQKTGELYITWEDAKANPNSTSELPASGVFISKSNDGGVTWSSPIVANPTTLGVQTFSPSIAIAENGNIGISFYDFRKYQDEGDFYANLKTDIWLAVFDPKLHYRLNELRLTPQSFDARKFTFFPGQGWEISDVGTIDAVENDFLIVNPTTNTPYGGGPVTLTPGVIYDDLPVSLKYFRASPKKSKCKLKVEPFLNSSVGTNERSAMAIDKRLKKLGKRLKKYK